MEKKKIKMSNDAINVVVGINLMLISVLILLSNFAQFLNFIAKGIAFVVGFIGFWVLVPYLFILGIYICFKKHLQKFKVGLSLAGLVFVIFGIALLTSHYATLPLEILKPVDDAILIVKEKDATLDWNNAIEVFKVVFAKAFNTKEASLYEINGAMIEGGVTSTSLGGGFFFFVFLGLFNSIANSKPILSIIIASLLIVVGFLLLINRLIKKIFTKKEKKVQKEEHKQNEIIENSEESIEHLISPTTETNIYSKYRINDEDEVNDSLLKYDNGNSDDLLEKTMESFNKQHTIQKARFDFDNDEPFSNDNVVQEENNHQYQNFDNGFQNVLSDNTIGLIKENKNYSNDQLNLNTPNNILETNESSFDFDNDDTIEDFNLQTEQNVNDNIIEQQDDLFEEIVPEEPEKIIENNKIEPIKEVSSPANNIVSSPTNNNEYIQPQPKKKILHWDDDDEIDVDIPKATPRGDYVYPPLSLLEPHESNSLHEENVKYCLEQIELLKAIFEELKIGATITGYTIGPAVTRLDIKMNEGVSVNVISKNLDDISVRLGGVNVLFNQLVIGKNTSGLDIPNLHRSNVGLYESLKTMPPVVNNVPDLSCPFGKDISGKIITLKVSDAPHMLVGGTTGSGKSVFIHSVILSLIMRNRPEDLKLLLIDPKGVEMTFYKKIPHLICPMIYEPEKANVALCKLVDEMEHRNRIFQSVGVRELKEYNKNAPKLGYEILPSIVVVIDEYADLSENCKEISGNVLKLAQKARTTGIHLIIATQRPSVNIINGVIKANLPTRVALSVKTAVDSNVILDRSGAESLLGNGDMLIDSPKLARNQLTRIQSCYMDTIEINNVCSFLRNHYQPMYWDEFNDLTNHNKDIQPTTMVNQSELEKASSDDQLYEIIKTDIQSREFCSISLIQRTYGIGFNRAGKMFNRLRSDGYLDLTDVPGRGSKVIIKAPLNEQGVGTVEQTEIIFRDE